MTNIFLTFLPTAVCLFWSIATITRLCETRKLHYCALSLFTVTCTVLYWCHGMFFCHQTTFIPYSDTMYSFCNLAVFPLFFCYITSITSQSKGHYRQTLVWLIPSFICGIATGIIYALLSPEETQQFINEYLYNSTFDSLSGKPLLLAYTHIVCRIVFALQIPPILLIGSRHIKQFNETVDSMYADTDSKSLYSIHKMLYFFILTSIFSIIFNIVGKHFFATSIWFLAIPSILFSCMLYTLGYIGCRHDFTLEDIENDNGPMYQCNDHVPDQQDTADADTDISYQPSELRLRIEQIMTEEKLFLRNNLKLADLVQALGSNRNYVYNAINKEMGVSFTEYVNRLRIDYACEMLKQHPNITILNLSRKSGFTSPVSFYRNFKLYKGCVPKDYEHK